MDHWCLCLVCFMTSLCGVPNRFSSKEQAASLGNAFLQSSGSQYTRKRALNMQYELASPFITTIAGREDLRRFLCHFHEQIHVLIYKNYDKQCKTNDINVIDLLKGLRAKKTKQKKTTHI